MSSSSSNKNTFERKDEEALNALVNLVQQVEPGFMKEEAAGLEKAQLNTVSTYWALEGTVGSRGISRISFTMSKFVMTFDDGESILVHLPEKSSNRFRKLLEAHRGKKIALLNFQYNPTEHSIMFRDVGTMVLVENEDGEMVIPACNYGPHSIYNGASSATSRFSGSKRLASDMDDAVPSSSSVAAPSSSSAAAPSSSTVNAPSSAAAAISPTTILGGSLDFANLDHAALLEFIAKMGPKL